MASSESRIVQAQMAPNRTCLNLGHAHDCRFYSCFEERFPCGSTFWMFNWGQKYCQRTQQARLHFDKTGQQLIEQISACVTDALIKQRFYTLNNINCEQLRVAGQRVVHECYMAHAKLFCSAFQGKNRDCFNQLIDNDDQHDLSMMRTLSSVGQKCTPKKRLIDMRSKNKYNRCLPSSTF
jgi:hypothetical protein